MGDLKHYSSSNLSNTLAGNVPGIIAMQTSGQPGRNTSEFWIRGISTFGAGSKAYILVDGFERDNINDLNIEDIESFSVLKDASATAIYGSKGANGVILITTKHGQAGKIQVNGKLETSYNTRTKTPEFVDGIGYANLHGGVASKKRQELITRFMDDADCRIFLSTDAGSTGLNLQVASTIINLDLPWNPAVLEQRIARIYRLGQQRNIQVINLVAHNSFEEEMLDKLRFKSAMFEGVLDNGQDTIFVGDKGKFAEMMDDLNDMMKTDSKPASDKAKPEETVMETMPSRDLPSDENTSSSATTQAMPSKAALTPATEPEDLLSQGVSFLSGLAQTLQSPEKTERLVESLVETDKETGETTLRIPVADKKSVRDMLGLIGRLFTMHH